MARDNGRELKITFKNETGSAEFMPITVCRKDAKMAWSWIPKFSKKNCVKNGQNHSAFLKIIPKF